MGQWTKARIQLCGRFIADIDGSRIEDALPGRIGRILFAYLVLNRGRPLPRDTLLMAGWGEDAPAEARNALNVLLSKLRRGLGSEHLRGRTEIELLLPSATFVDAEAALEGAHRAESAIAEGRWVQAWGPAGIAYHVATRPFLTGLEALWIDEWRRRLEEVRLRGLECFAAASLGLGGPALAQAEERARMLTELAPYRETGHRLLMEALARRGNVAEALRAYERLRVLLREELGITPSPTVQGVHRRLLEAQAAKSCSACARRSSRVTLPTSSGCKMPIWPCAFFQSSSSSSPWMTYPHMQMILSAIANLQANPLPSSRAVAPDANTHSDLPDLPGSSW